MQRCTLYNVRRNYYVETIVNSCITMYDFNFYVHGSVRRESISVTVQQHATAYSLLYLCKLLASGR